MEILLSAAETLVPPPVTEVAKDHPPLSDPPIPAEALPSFDVAALVGSDWVLDVPADVAKLLRLLPLADVYVQDEVEIRLHPTLTRCWCRKGKVGQHLVQAPGQNRKVVASGAVDWRDGWHSMGYGFGRTAKLFVEQLDHLVERSRARGRIALVLLDNARTHTRQGSKLVREALERHGDWLRLVYTPPYDPEAEPIERLWRPMRRAVTHNHHRSDLWTLYCDLEAYFDALDEDPQRVLRHIGSPFAIPLPASEATAA